MAKILSDSAGIVIDADFLDGKLQGGVTVASVDINQDIVQFFQKIMALASMTGNNDFDNEVNGYQFIDALKVFNKYYYENYTSGSIDPTSVPAGHLWLSKDGQVQIDDAGNLAAHDITSVTNFIGDNAIKIAVSVNSLGVLKKSSGSIVVEASDIIHVTTGEYLVTVSVPSDAVIIVSVNISGYARVAQAFNNTVNIPVFTYLSDGTPFNAPFSIMVL